MQQSSAVPWGYSAAVADDFNPSQKQWSVWIIHPKFVVENHQPDTVSTRVTVDNWFSLAYYNSSFAAYRAASSIWLHENSQYQTHPYFASSPYLPSFSKPLIQTIGPQSDLRQCPRFHHIKLEYVFNQAKVFN